MNKYIYIYIYLLCILYIEKPINGECKRADPKGVRPKKSIWSQLNKARRGVGQAKAEEVNFPVVRELAPNVGPALPCNSSLA